MKKLVWIIIILFLIVLIVIFGYYIYQVNKYPLDRESSSEIDNFQKILNEYSSCLNNKDIECQCKYLIDFQCNRLRESGSQPESIYASGAKLIKRIGEGNYTDTNVNKGKPTKVIAFSFRSKELEKRFRNEVTGDCFNVKFIEDVGKWKLNGDVDPSFEESCKI